MTPPPRSLAGNFLALISSRVIQIASGFFVLLAAARWLSLDAYGTYASVTAMAGAAAAMTYCGIQQIMIREMAARRNEAPAIVGQALLLRLCLVALCGLALAVAGFFADYGPEARLGLALAFCLEACRSLGQLGCAVFQAHERMGYEPPLSIVSGLASVALVGGALWHGLGYTGVLAGLTLAAGLHAALAWRVVWRDLTRPSLRFSRAELWRMLGAASVVGLGVFFHQNLFRANTLVLSFLADAAAVADFQAPHEFILKLEILPQALMLAVFPALSRLAPIDPLGARRLFRLIFRHTLHVMALPSILLAYYAEPACVLLFGQKFQGAAMVLRLLALALAPLALDMLVNNVLVAIGRQRYALYYASAALALNVAGNIYAVPRYGAVGSAVVALCSYVWLLIFSTRFAARHSYRPHALGPLVRVLCASGACLGACMLLRHAPILGAASGTLVYLAVLVGLKGFGPHDLAELRSVAKPRPQGAGDPGERP
ncbi:oligosaccharide flippase family protein [Solidesulfovibrio sp.]|uniref:oligosaccharide flippase family protein n=1 Tax=Solidesulfovibrio sp. TaxID=2910990 RepID=UPI0026083093|nr:oligosaccharide flippase family protein [Solidesulfovibrio sp.]